MANFFMALASLRSPSALTIPTWLSPLRPLPQKEPKLGLKPRRPPIVAFIIPATLGKPGITHKSRIQKFPPLQAQQPAWFSIPPSIFTLLLTAGMGFIHPATARTGAALQINRAEQCFRQRLARQAPA